MDFGAPVAQNVNVNAGGGLDMLSKLLNAKQAQQNLQTGAIQQQGLQAEVQQQQQTAKQRSAIANVDWSKYVGDDGTLSTDKLLSDPSVRQAAGDQFPQLLTTAASIKGQQITNKKSLADLNGEVRGQLGQVAGRLGEDDDVRADQGGTNGPGRQKVAQMLTQFGQESPEAARVAKIYGPMVENAPQGKLADALKVLQLQASDVSAQLQRATPQPTSYTTPSGDIGFINTKPTAGIVGAPIGQPVRQGLSPTEQPAYKGQLAGVEADTQVYQGARIADAHAPRVIALAQALQGMASQGSAAVANNPALAKTLRSLGVESSGVANTAIMDKLTANLSRELMAAPRSDADQREIQNMLPDVAKGPEAVRAAADQIIQRARYDQGKLSFMEKHGISNSRPMGAADAENQFTRSTPAPPTSQQPAPGAPKEGATGQSKSGKPIIFRNGRWEYQ